RANTGREADHPRSISEPIACKDVNPFVAFSCPWPPSSTFYKLLARIIHQPKKPTKEGILGSRMMLKTAVSQEHHNPTNTRIRLCWHCTNRSHSRDQAQCVLAAPSGLQQALRTWVLDSDSRQPVKASIHRAFPLVF